jgi:hypothetical protein
MERVEKLLQVCERPIGWGHPGLDATPTAVAIRELAAQNRALAKAVREIASEVQTLSS